MKIMKKLFNLKSMAVLLAALTLVCTFTLTAFADAEDSGYVYVSVSMDGQFVSDRNGAAVAYIPVNMSDLAAISLEEYGLEGYCYDGDNDEIFDITALHLYVYVHEQIFGLDWSDVQVSGGPGSIFFEEGLFGFEDCNLNYYLNGVYPELYPGWGVTVDNILISAGDFYDVAGYTSWEFWMDSAAGFNYFADADGNITHSYTTESGVTSALKLVRSGGGFGGELNLTEVSGMEIYYGSALGDADGCIVTDDLGEATLPALSEGVWYLWCDGGYGAEYSNAIVSAPAYATVTVKGGAVQPEPTVIAEGFCGESVGWTIMNNGTLTVNGSGSMYDFTPESHPWYPYADRITRVVIGDGVTSVGRCAFYGMSGITEVALPETLETVSAYAFYGCSGIAEIRIPDAVTVIESYAFRKCSSLTEASLGISYGWSVGGQKLSAAEAEGMTVDALTKMYYKSVWERDVNALPEEADGGFVAGGACNSYTKWVLTYIDEAKTKMKLSVSGNGIMPEYGTANAPWFKYADAIVEIEVSEGVTTVGRCAFYGLRFVKKITLAESIVSIGDYAFNICRSLKEITIPGSVTSIGKDAFAKTALAVIPTV